MPDCFISYSAHDHQLAAFVRDELRRHTITSFMASVSVLPGEQWSPEILTNLRSANWVLILASRAASASAYVNQEIGGALLLSKNLVPIVWDMSPAELPGWLKEFQAIDLRDSTLPTLQQHIAAIASRIKQEKATGYLILGAVAVALLVLGGKK